MNHIDQSLKRLLNNAAAAPPVGTGSLSPGLEAKIIADWRKLEPDEWSGLLPLFFRRSLVCASLIVLSTLCWTALENRGAVPGATALANLNDNVMQVLPWEK